MSISKQKSYDPKAVEKKLYEKWEQSGIFKPGEKGIPYCIALPPPNVTGSLHMGHAFQDTLMDILIRYKRMSGRKTLWQGGTDHAGIATQIVVERQLESAGKSRQEIGREKFVEAVWDWKKKSGGTISKQLRRMGSSIDWSRERFTLDDDLSLAVRQVFVSLYAEGLIYKGKRLVNWDPVLKTAISDLEVISEMEKGYLWHFKYPIKNSKQFVIIATTRPETLLGDSAVAVNPLDDRYKTLIGKTVELPLTNREIPIIADNYVDKEFGSGCLKVTPAHDFNDYEIGKRHNLEVINIFQEDGHLNSSVPDNFVGLERYEARKKIVSEMDRRGLLAKTEEHQLMVPRGDRTRTVIEPFLTDQWFVRMEALARPALDAVRNGEVKFVPQNWAKTYYDWLENIQDWCISRQLWWGHRIPAWYDAQGNIFVGMNEKDVRRENSIPSDNILRQDEDVLDTWFSSALWPFSTLGWPKETKELSTFYPTSVLVTGFDIIFFWVARMIMMGLKIMGAVPFREVYIHGLVRDSEGNKMSKSKGNIIDPIDLIDGITLEELVTKRTSNLMLPEDAVSIEKNTKKDFPDGIPAFGTDALRLTFAAMATTGRDIRFDLGRIGGYRNFCNKIWNASRFVVLTLKEHSVSEKFTTGLLGEAENWIYFRLEMTLNLVRKNFDSYRFDLASNAIYEFIWDDFCDWYIESSKVTLSNPSSTPKRKQVVLQTLIDVMQTALSALHPIMPFISEALWNELEACQDNPRTFSSIVFPTETKFKGNKKSHDQFELIKKFVLEVRRIRSSYNVNPKQEITTFVNYPESKINNYFGNNIDLVKSLGKISSIKIIPQSKPLKIATGLADKITIYVPLEDLVDIEAERVRLKRDLGKLKSSKGRITQKLKNKNFLSKAPKEVIRKEEEKLIEIDIAIDHTEKQIINFQ
ncbi:MAG: valine--tRNA ligase [Pseudomonadota bacterium]|nr:valine--tRNA ligase [Pseudomonadota bacterium]